MRPNAVPLVGAVFLVIILVATTTSPVHGQTSVAASEQNQLAQAEYYRAQTKKLRHFQPGDWITPLAALGAVIATVIGASINAHATRKNHTESQEREIVTRREQRFDEALKRFGDKDSWRLRASAASLLAEIAERQPMEFLRDGADQLFIGLTSEDYILVLRAIRRALERIAQKDPQYASEGIQDLHNRLRLQVAQDVLDLVLVSGVEFDKLDYEEDDNDSRRLAEEMKRLCRKIFDRASSLTQINRLWLYENMRQEFGGLLETIRFAVTPGREMQVLEQDLIASGLRIREAVELAKKVPLPKNTISRLNDAIFIKRQSRWNEFGFLGEPPEWLTDC